MRRIALCICAALLALLSACGVSTTDVSLHTAGPQDVKTESPAPSYTREDETKAEDVKYHCYTLPDGYWYLDSVGVAMKCLDEIPLNSGSHWEAYSLDNGELSPLKSRRFRADYDYNGHQYPIEFDWCEYNGRAIITYLNPESERDYFRITYSPQAPDKFVIGLVIRDENASVSLYPVMANLHEGTVKDVFKDEEIGSMDNVTAFSSLYEGKYLAIERDYGREIWLANLQNHQTANISDLVDLSDADYIDYSIRGNHMVLCRTNNYFGGIGEIGDSGQAEKSECVVWSIDLSDYSVEEVYREESFADGLNIHLYGALEYAVIQDDSGLEVINMTSGERHTLTGADGLGPFGELNITYSQSGEEAIAVDTASNSIYLLHLNDGRILNIESDEPIGPSLAAFGENAFASKSGNDVMVLEFQNPLPLL